jgi:hypothetical protein
LLVAAVGGAVSWSLGNIEVGGVLALVAFAAALGAELYGALARPERAWYEGRAAAESAKTLTWRYATRGESFEDVGDPTTDSRFLASLNDLLHDLGDLQLDPGQGVEEQITGRMRELRAESFAVRRDAYLTGRIRDQQSWYTGKATTNKRRGHFWLIVSIALEAAGLIGGALRAFAGVDVDLLGVFAALAATVTAWVQAKQHQNLATAYGITALELASVASEAVALTDESAWGRFVGEAEEAISREHTLWRASRGLRIRPQRG